MSLTPKRDAGSLPAAMPAAAEGVEAAACGTVSHSAAGWFQAEIVRYPAWGPSSRRRASSLGDANDVEVKAVRQSEACNPRLRGPAILGLDRLQSSS